MIYFVMFQAPGVEAGKASGKSQTCHPTVIKVGINM